MDEATVDDNENLLIKTSYKEQVQHNASHVSSNGNAQGHLFKSSTLSIGCLKSNQILQKSRGKC